VIAPGRLVVPAIGRNIFSDDHGQTWQYEKLPPGTSEGTIVELNDGTLLRNDRATKKMWEENGKRRMLARGSISAAADSSWMWQPCDELLDPKCQGSAIAFNNSADERHILFLNSASTETRMKMRLRRCTDNGRTWGESWSLYDIAGCPKPKGKPLKGVGAYSSLTRTADGMVAALVEQEEEDGTCSVSLVAFQLPQLPDVFGPPTLARS
jgi:sialidase-1